MVLIGHKYLSIEEVMGIMKFITRIKKPILR